MTPTDADTPRPDPSEQEDPSVHPDAGARAGLRRRVRAAGGWYAWVNAGLIRAAGPASVGPYETTPPPSVQERAERACPLCGSPMTAHTFDRSGPKPLMHCP